VRLSIEDAIAKHTAANGMASNATTAIEPGSGVSAVSVSAVMTENRTSNGVCVATSASIEDAHVCPCGVRPLVVLDRPSDRRALSAEAKPKDAVSKTEARERPLELPEELANDKHTEKTPMENRDKDANSDMESASSSTGGDSSGKNG